MMAPFLPARIAPRASKVTDPTLPESVLGIAPPKAAEMAVGLGAPEDNRVANPLMTCCFPFVSSVPLQLESVPMVQAGGLGCCIRKQTCVFRRTASKRVNFSMSDKRDAASFN